MQINITNMLNAYLSLDIVVEPGPGPQTRVIRQRLAPGGSYDASGDLTLEELNENVQIQALLAAGTIDVAVVEEASDILSPRVESLVPRVDTLEDDVVDLENDIDTLESDLGLLVPRVDLLEDDVVDLENDIDTLESDFGSQFNRLRTDAAIASHGIVLKKVSMPVASAAGAATVNNPVLSGRVVARVVSASVCWATAPSSALGTVVATLNRRTGAGGATAVSAADIDMETVVDDTPTDLTLSTVAGADVLAATDLLYFSITTDNADAVAGVGGVLTVELEEVDTAIPLHKVDPDDVPSSITTDNATDLPTAIALANDLKDVMNLHFASGDEFGAHISASALSVTADDASDLPTTQTLLNECKADWNGHCVEAGVHIRNAVESLEAVADASDQATSEALANALKAKYNGHVASIMESLPIS